MCHFLAGKAETVITLDGSLCLIVSHSNDDVFLTSDMLLNTACVSSGPLSLFLSNSLRWAMIRLLNTDCFIDLLINEFATIYCLFSSTEKCVHLL
jgi:hypothetical protein